MADVIYIDYADGIKRVVNNAKLYARLLTKFRNETKIGDLEASLAAGNLETAQEQTHTLKGVAANLSLTELFKQSLELETQIKAKAVVPEQIEIVKSVLEATIVEIDKVIAENG